MTQLLTNPTDNQRVLLPGHTWSHFKQLQGAIAQSSKARLCYYQGRIEIVIPGKEHGRC